MIEVVRACVTAGELAKGGGILLLRTNRPDAGYFLLQSRGCREQIPTPSIKSLDY